MVHVPFVLHDGLALVDAAAGGHEGRFVIDTGCSLTSLDAAWAAAHGIRAEESPIRSAHGSGTVAVSLATTSFRLGDLAIDSQKVVLVALDGVSKEFGIAIDGIIGYDIFIRGIADIDFRSQTFSIGDLPPATGDLIPVDLTYRIPIATATIVPIKGTELTARMAIDLGSTHLDVRLLGPFVDAHESALEQLERMPGSFGTGVFHDRRLVLDYARNQVIVA